MLHPAKALVDVPYSLAHAVVKPHKTSQPHRLKTTEVYYILEGQGSMHINDETSDVHAGTVVYIPPMATQWIKNTGRSNLEFLCIVNPPWRVEDEEVL